MNRIATRAFAVLILVLLLVSGMVFFFCDYLVNAKDWIMFQGSPHVYDGTKIGTGVIADREGQLLLDQSENRTYAEEASLRKAFLHWVGDRSGNIRPGIVETYSDALLGYDAINGVYSYGTTQGELTLTLSADVQAAALEAMGDRVGTLAVYNYQTGELICAVTTPIFDPEAVPDIANDETGAYTGIYVNRYTQSKYIPGSIFKIVTLAIALETIPDIQEQSFTCTGSYIIQSGDITCENVHGKQTLKESFCNSCNCAFAQIVEQIGREKLQRYVELFGITESVSFDGITTVEGNFDLQDATGEQVAWSGIGQHRDQINPCAFLAFVGAIANDGVQVTPHVVKEVRVGKNCTYEAKVQKNGRILSQSTAKILQEYMSYNVTAKYGADKFPGLNVSAKSGTGEVGGDKKPNALFTGFITDSKYPLAFIAVVEDGGYGASVCVPVVSKVLQACVGSEISN